MNVRHQHGARLRNGTATDTLADRNADAGHLSLEGAENQLAFRLQEIEPRPVEVWHGVEDQGGKIGGVGYGIALTLQQTLELACKLAIEKLFVALFDFLRNVHGSALHS